MTCDAAKWRAREQLAETSPALIDALVKLGDEYGPTGVVKVAQLIIDGWEPGLELADYGDGNRGL